MRPPILAKATLLCLMSLMLCCEAYADVRIARSVPKADDILTQTPLTVSITFSEVLRPNESRITLVDDAGKTLNDGKVTASLDRTTLTTPLPPLKPGSYTVSWKAVCLCDDHRATEGSYSFSVQ